MAVYGHAYTPWWIMYLGNSKGTPPEFPIPLRVSSIGAIAAWRSSAYCPFGKQIPKWKQKHAKWGLADLTNLLSQSTMSSQADQLKAEGNALFAKKKFTAAYKKYSDALEHDDKNPILYSNRAACCLNLNRYAYVST